MQLEHIDNQIYNDRTRLLIVFLDLNLLWPMWTAATPGWESGWVYKVVKKTDTQFYFWDKFGNSAPILTILTPLYKQKFMAREREVLLPTTPLLCDHLT